MKDLRTESLENVMGTSGGDAPGGASGSSGADGSASPPQEPAAAEASGPQQGGSGGHTPPSGSQAEVVPGMRLGKYKIIRRLGEGGMSAVFEAVHVDIHKPVAIKVLSNALAQQEEAQVRFLREAASASRLQHPHVVDVSDFGTEAGRSYLVMELMRGEDLSQHIQRRGPMPIDALADVMLPICAGVQAAHDMKIVHRDLKPQNIFLCRTAMGGTVPKVLDFGISKVVDAQTAALTHSGMMMGTPYYLSPEQIIQNSADHRSDQYALGVILYECSTGRRPHEAETLYGILNSITQGSYPRPRAIKADLPEDFENLILRTLAQDAARRFPSVHALGRALMAFASERQRVIWEEYYASPPAMEVMDPESSAPMPAAAKSGSTEILRDVNRAALTPAATRMLPEGMHAGSSSFRPASTGGSLQAVDTDIAVADFQRRLPRLAVVAGVAVLVVGGAVWALPGSSGKDAEKSSRPSASAAEKVSEVPSPAAAALPEPVSTTGSAAKAPEPAPEVPPSAPAVAPAAGTVPPEQDDEPRRRKARERVERAERSRPRARPVEAPVEPAAATDPAARRRAVEKSGGVPILE